LHLDSVVHEQVQDRDSVLAFMRSISYVAKRPERARALMPNGGALLPEGDYAFDSRGVRWAVRA
jgi:hypothetical protein